MLVGTAENCWVPEEALGDGLIEVDDAAEKLLF
jgi:hypothetical protein